MTKMFLFGNREGLSCNNTPILIYLWRELTDKEKRKSKDQLGERLGPAKILLAGTRLLRYSPLVTRRGSNWLGGTAASIVAGLVLIFISKYHPKACHAKQ